MCVGYSQKRWSFILNAEQFAQVQSLKIALQALIGVLGARDITRQIAVDAKRLALSAASDHAGEMTDDAGQRIVTSMTAELQQIFAGAELDLPK